MKPDEKIAYDFLSSNFKGKIQYEPIPNSPPDFLLKGNIAVEVRRLNKYVFSENIEDKYYKIKSMFRSITDELNIKTDYDKSYLVSVIYNRPIKLTKKDRKGIIKLLSDSSLDTGLNNKIFYSENLSFNIKQAKTKMDVKFKLVSFHDKDKGGFPSREKYESLKIILSEKEGKIKSNFDQFNIWWLILIDHIDPYSNNIDKRQLLSLPYIQNKFDKIFILSSNSSFFFEYKEG